MMNRKHRRTFLALSVVALLSAGGCATPALMKEANKQEYRDYQETISQVLLTADSTKLVILGATYHYIFDTPDGFAALLDSPLHTRLAARFSLFRVNQDADVEGRFVLVLDHPSDDERQAAITLGFRGPQAGVKRNFDLRGKRYAAGNFSMPASARTLNQSYTIEEGSLAKGRQTGACADDADHAGCRWCTGRTRHPFGAGCAGAICQQQLALTCGIAAIVPARYCIVAFGVVI